MRQRYAFSVIAMIRQSNAHEQRQTRMGPDGQPQQPGSCAGHTRIFHGRNMQALSLSLFSLSLPKNRLGSPMGMMVRISSSFSGVKKMSENAADLSYPCVCRLPPTTMYQGSPLRNPRASVNGEPDFRWFRNHARFYTIVGTLRAPDTFSHKHPRSRQAKNRGLVRPVLSQRTLRVFSLRSPLAALTGRAAYVVRRQKNLQDREKDC